MKFVKQFVLNSCATN